MTPSQQKEYEKNLEEIRKETKKKKVNEYQRKLYAKRKEYHKEYYKKNKEKINEYSKKYYQENKENWKYYQGYINKEELEILKQ